MIEVEFFYFKRASVNPLKKRKDIEYIKGIIGGFSVMGHSTQATKGQNLVCAAVSALVQNLAHSLRILTCAQLSVESVESIEDDKNIYNLRIISRPVTKDMRLLLESLFLGLSNLSKQFPKEITVHQIRLKQEAIQEESNGS